jgi:hypothetical protein
MSCTNNYLLFWKAKFSHKGIRVIPDFYRFAAKGFVPQQGEQNGFLGIGVNAKA